MGYESVANSWLEINDLGLRYANPQLQIVNYTISEGVYYGLKFSWIVKHALESWKDFINYFTYKAMLSEVRQKDERF